MHVAKKRFSSEMKIFAQKRRGCDGKLLSEPTKDSNNSKATYSECSFMLISNQKSFTMNACALLQKHLIRKNLILTHYSTRNGYG